MLSITVVPLRITTTRDSVNPEPTHPEPLAAPAEVSKFIILPIVTVTPEEPVAGGAPPT